MIWIIGWNLRRTEVSVMGIAGLSGFWVVRLHEVL